MIVNRQSAAEILANTFRPDMQAPVSGAGRHGFDLAVPGGLSRLVRQVIEVRRWAEGAGLVASTVVTEAALGLDAAMAGAAAPAMAAVADPAERHRMLTFLAAQAE